MCHPRITRRCPSFRATRAERSFSGLMTATPWSTSTLEKAGELPKKFEDKEDDLEKYELSEGEVKESGGQRVYSCTVKGKRLVATEKKEWETK